MNNNGLIKKLILKYPGDPQFLNNADYKPYYVGTYQIY